MPNLWAKMEVQFNDHNATVVGRIIDCSHPKHFLVDFEHNNVQFCGLWDKNECVLVDEPIVPKVGDVWRTHEDHIVWIVGDPNGLKSMLYFNVHVGEWWAIPFKNKLKDRLGIGVSLYGFREIFSQETNLFNSK